MFQVLLISLISSQFSDFLFVFFFPSNKSDSRFMSYLPSVLATATMIHVVNSVEPRLGAEYQSQLLGILGINKVIKCVLNIYADSLKGD